MKAICPHGPTSKGKKILDNFPNPTCVHDEVNVKAKARF